MLSLRRIAGGFPGGQAEYVKVPFGDVNCQKIPDEVSDEEAIYLSDVLPTSYHCVVDTGVTEGDTVAVWVGCGWVPGGRTVQTDVHSDWYVNRVLVLSVWRSSSGAS